MSDVWRPVKSVGRSAARDSDSRIPVALNARSIEIGVYAVAGTTADSRSVGRLVVDVRGVDRSQFTGVPSTIDLCQRILREGTVYLPATRASFDVQLRWSDRTEWQAKADVAATFSGVRTFRAIPDRDANRNRDEFGSAARRGLIGPLATRKAEARVGINSLRRELDAYREANFLPDECWQLDVQFGRWTHIPSGAVVSPEESKRLRQAVDKASIRFPHRERVAGLFG